MIILSLCFNFFGLPGVASASSTDYTATYTNSTATTLPSTTASITSTVTATYAPTTIPKSTQTGLTVHFKKPSSWNSAIRIHYWNLNPTTVPISGAWPGILMKSDGNDWYSYTIAEATGSSLIFNDGSGKQTADLSRSVKRAGITQITHGMIPARKCLKFRRFPPLLYPKHMIRPNR